MGSKFFPISDTYASIIQKLGFVPAVSSTQSILSDLVIDGIPGEVVALDSSNYVVQPGASVLRPGYFKDSVSKAALAAYFSNTVIYSPLNGQSLAGEGGAYTPVIINTTQSRTGKVLIPSPGIFPNGTPWYDVRDAIDEYYTAANINLGSTSAGAASSRSVSFGNCMYDKINATFGATLNIQPTILLVNVSAGGTSIINLGPGTAAGEEEIQHMIYAYNWAKKNGLDIDMPFARWRHGNEDGGVTGDTQYQLRLMDRQKFLTDARWHIFRKRGEVILYVEQSVIASTGVGDVFAASQAQINIRRRSTVIRPRPPSSNLYHIDGTHEDSPNYDINNAADAQWVFADWLCGGVPAFAVDRGWWVSSTVARFLINTYFAPLVLDYSDKSFTGTFDATADTFTKVAHTLTNGITLLFRTTGGLPPELTAGNRYYTINVTADTFQVSATQGGAAINLSTAGTGTTTCYVGGENITFDDDSGAAPYVNLLTVVESGLTSGTVVFDATADTGTVANIKIPDGTRVVFQNTGGALPPELVAGTSYFTRDGTLSTFKLAATAGGAAINLSTAGSGTSTFARLDNAPYGDAIIEVTLSAAPATYGRQRFMFGLLAGSVGTVFITRPGNIIRDSAPDTIAHDRSNTAVTFTMNNRMHMQEVIMNGYGVK